MSAIDPTVPVDTEQRSQGGSRIREHRQQLYDFATAFLARHQGSGYDPSTWTGEFNIPFSAPGTPVVGDFYFTTGGLLYSYKAGPALQLTGDIPAGSVGVFNQSAAPTGWTRKTDLLEAAFLRYVTGTPGSGGTDDPGAAIVHGQPRADVGTPNTASTTVFAGVDGADYPAGTRTPNHAAYLFRDILMASK